LILEPFVSHTGLSSPGACTSPGAFSRQAHGNSYTGMGTELEKIAYFGTNVAPLFPLPLGVAHDNCLSFHDIA